MINISSNDFYAGIKTDDPDSPAYVPSILGRNLMQGCCKMSTGT